jgi:hypothetical protein
VNDPGCVRLRQAGGNLGAKRRQLAKWQRSCRDQIAQRVSLDALEDQVRARVARPDFVERDDVGMIQRRHRSSFAFEAREPFRIGGDVSMQDFDRDVTPEPRISRAIDLAHPACA